MRKRQTNSQPYSTKCGEVFLSARCKRLNAKYLMSSVTTTAFNCYWVLVSPRLSFMIPTWCNTDGTVRYGTDGISWALVNFTPPQSPVASQLDRFVTGGCLSSRVNVVDVSQTWLLCLCHGSHASYARRNVTEFFLKRESSCLMTSLRLLLCILVTLVYRETADMKGARRSRWWFSDVCLILLTSTDVSYVCY